MPTGRGQTRVQHANLRRAEEADGNLEAALYSDAAGDVESRRLVGKQLALDERVELPFVSGKVVNRRRLGKQGVVLAKALQPSPSSPAVSI